MNQLITAFNGGEVSPLLTGRLDLPVMRRACRLMRGFIPGVAGGAFRRPPLLHVDTTGTEPVRLIPFNYSAAASYQIEAGNKYINIRDAGGTGTAVRLNAPWSTADLEALQWVQSNDVMWLTCPGAPPQELQRKGTQWTLTEIPWKYPPLRDENLGAATLKVKSTTGEPPPGAPEALPETELTAGAELFAKNLHEGSYWEISHFRGALTAEIQIPVIPSASAVLALTVLPVEDQRFFINGASYQWKKADNVSAPYHVAIGEDANPENLTKMLTVSRDNAVAAINARVTDDEIVQFGIGTAPHPDVSAESGGELKNSTSATARLSGNGNALTPNHAENAEVKIGAYTYRFDDNDMHGDGGDHIYDVRRGNSVTDSLGNLVKAINLAGKAGIDYVSKLKTAHPDVTAAMEGTTAVILTARAQGTSGNAVTTTVAHTTELSFSAATLTGGVASASYKVIVTARTPGDAGNNITTGGGAATLKNTSGTNVTSGQNVAIGGVTYVFTDTLASLANQVQRESTIDASLLNLIRAVNRSGTPGAHYTTATEANPVVTALPAVDTSGGEHNVHFYVKTSDPLTAAQLALTTTSGVLDWGAPALRNLWNTPKLTGAKDVDRISNEIEVKGQWDFTTSGRWIGTVYIEQKNGAGQWDVLRRVAGRLDTNRTLSGIVEGVATLRLKAVGMSGKESSEVPAPRFLLETAESMARGLVRIKSVETATKAIVQVLSPLHSTEATANWREGAFSNYSGFPAAVVLHEQRLIFAGTASEPQKLWASITGDFRNFEQTGFDDGSWQYELATQEGNAIRWVASQTGLIIGTAGDEWLMEGGEKGITPTNAQAKRQSAYGSDPVQPILAGSVVLFVQRGGLSLLEYVYDFQQAGYIAPELTQMVEHLTREGIRSMALQRAPWPVLWAVTGDGQLLACTYARASEVIAWAPQPVEGMVESVSVVYGQRGYADEVWLAVQRNGNRRLERFAHDHWRRLHTGGKTWHMDAAVVCTAANGNLAGGTASGLQHLEGRTVAVLANGNETALQMVQGGKVSVPGATEIIAGLVPPESALQPAVFDLPLETGSSQGRRYHVPELAVRFYQSRECSYADAPGKPVYDVVFRDSESSSASPPPLFTGVKFVSNSASFNTSADVVLMARGIHPLNVLSIIPRVQIYGS